MGISLTSGISPTLAWDVWGSPKRWVGIFPNFLGSPQTVGGDLHNVWGSPQVWVGIYPTSEDLPNFGCPSPPPSDFWGSPTLAKDLQNFWRSPQLWVGISPTFGDCPNFGWGSHRFFEYLEIRLEIQNLSAPKPLVFRNLSGYSKHV